MSFPKFVVIDDPEDCENDRWYDGPEGAFIDFNRRIDAGIATSPRIFELTLVDIKGKFTVIPLATRK